MIPPLPPRVDSSFQRIADKLSVLELMSSDEEDFLSYSFDKGERGETRFLNFYSHNGIRLAMDAYGFTEQLAELGLAPNDLIIERDDAFHHRMQLYRAGGRDLEHRIMDMRVHLRQVAEPTTEDEEAKARRTFGVLVIEWLSMQNPLAEFTPERPRLPGQTYPGTGLGRAIHNVLMLITQRLRRDAILNVPEHFHLARLYSQLGYRYPDRRRERELEAVVDAVSPLHFAVAGWAVERGFVLVTDDDGERPWKYEPVEMMLPTSRRMRRRIPGLAAWVAEKLFVEPLPLTFRVDVDGLRESLRTEPVEGIDPDLISG